MWKRHLVTDVANTKCTFEIPVQIKISNKHLRLLPKLQRNWKSFGVRACCILPVHNDVPAGQRGPVFMKGGPTVLQDELQVWVSRLQQRHLKIQRLPQIFHYWIVFCLVKEVVRWIWRSAPLDGREKKKKPLTAQTLSVFPGANEKGRPFSKNQLYLGLSSSALSAALSQSLQWDYYFLVYSWRQQSESHWPHSSRKQFAYREKACIADVVHLNSLSRWYIRIRDWMSLPTYNQDRLETCRMLLCSFCRYNTGQSRFHTACSVQKTETDGIKMLKKKGT